ncbi:hypothetical protein FB45DRAFT_1049884 [Roridomyces roridus]|uniref:Transposase n=1 Tax=Roridomyces roridus TaxID=1738132 RepID=A0AAD7CHW7_9AGAR|nr:hypothetical protein FB45DRAFT_1049884 [Roridomyces roridus]
MVCLCATNTLSVVLTAILPRCCPLIATPPGAARRNRSLSPYPISFASCPLPRTFDANFRSTCPLGLHQGLYCAHARRMALITRLQHTPAPTSLAHPHHDATPAHELLTGPCATTRLHARPIPGILVYQTVKSKIAFSEDTWTTRFMMFTFAGSIGSWITEDWELVERVLDFHPIEDKEHEGTFDSASPNDVLIAVLPRILADKFNIQFAPENSQIRCLAHVVNLVVQKILSTLNEADDPDVIDYYLPNKELPFYYDPDDDPDLKQMENEAPPTTTDSETTTSDEEDADVEVMQDMAAELEKLSPLQKRRARFKAIAAAIYRDELHKSGRKISSLVVIRDVKHRWNYTEAMLKRALILPKAIHRWLIEREELHPLLLKDEDWSMLASLRTMLKLFTQVTLQMSKSSTPTLSV